MRIAIVGAGPAGAHLARLLSERGCEALLFDARPPWEKPCGGGVTSKALREFPFLAGQSPKRMVTDLRLISAAGRELKIISRDDFAIYSRKDLACLLRDRAAQSGVEVHTSRVEHTSFAAGRWEIKTSTRCFEADFLVGADGANSVIRRRLGLRFSLEDFGYALGWHIRAASPGTRVEIKYLGDWTGYIWAFPRTDHLSYGIVTKYREAAPAELKARLLEFISARDPETAAEIRAARDHSTPRATFYGAMIPALSPESWDALRACDSRASWALVGDAAGFVDPITGEGIYYALKSAELLARALESRVADYDELWRAEFGGELRRAATMQGRFYHGRFAGAPIIERMVQLGRWHGGVRRTLGALVAGEQGYLDLKNRLRRRALAVI
jgi:geranylgeranyl reductase family protein